MGAGTDLIDEILARADELEAEGFDRTQAWGHANLESRIKNWPSEYGDDLGVLVFGDFSPPNNEIHLPDLGITVFPQKHEGSFIKQALCVLKARITVSEKSVAAVTDAAQRMNLMLGMHTLINWGNTGCGWWSYVTHGTMGGPLAKFEGTELLSAIDSFFQLPSKVQQKVNAALYWVRGPKNLMCEFHKSDLLNRNTLESE